MKISDIITDKYKLRIPPTVYYELLADVQEVEEEQEPKSEWQKDHEILKAYSDGANEVIDKIRGEIGNINLNEVAAKYEDRYYGFQREVIKILDKYKGESAEEDNKKIMPWYLEPFKQAIETYKGESKNS